jgi:hypothetical protein
MRLDGEFWSRSGPFCRADPRRWAVYRADVRWVPEKVHNKGSSPAILPGRRFLDFPGQKPGSIGTRTHPPSF